jgi:hypothetical protein
MDYLFFLAVSILAPKTRHNSVHSRCKSFNLLVFTSCHNCNLLLIAKINH